MLTYTERLTQYIVDALMSRGKTETEARAWAEVETQLIAREYGRMCPNCGGRIDDAVRVRHTGPMKMMPYDLSTLDI